VRLPCGGEAGQTIGIREAAWLKALAGPAFDFTGTTAFGDIQVHGNRMVIFLATYQFAMQHGFL